MPWRFWQGVVSLAALRVDVSRIRVKFGCGAFSASISGKSETILSNLRQFREIREIAPCAVSDRWYYIGITQYLPIRAASCKRRRGEGSRSDMANGRFGIRLLRSSP